MSSSLVFDVIDETDLTTPLASARYKVGTLYRSARGANTNLFRFVEAIEDLTDGDAVTQDTTSGTPKAWSVEASDAINEKVIGVANATVTFATAPFFFIQVSGLKADVNMASGVLKGEVLVSSASPGRLENIATVVDFFDNGIQANEDEAANQADCILSIV